MIDGLKPYLRMKDSGVPELGAVPEHWTVEPIARIGQLFKGRGANKEDEVQVGIPCVRYGDLYTRHEFFVTSTKACVAPDRASLYTPIRYGDVLFAASGETMEDIGRSAVNLLNVDARCGGDVIVLRPRAEIDPRFLGYAADAPQSRHQKARMGRGFTVVHIYASELKRLALPLPPPHEQRGIARFLDHADRQIRRYIRAKQKLIKLLEEQKQAIIHGAVTRGLDPEVRLKDSGAWFGKIPRYWATRPAKRIFREVDRRSSTGVETLLSLRMYKGLVPHRDVSVVPIAAEALIGFKKVEPGQIVMNRMRAAIGMFGIADQSGLVSPDYAVFEPITDVSLEYFLRLFKMPAAGAIFRAESKGLGTGSSGFMRLYTDRFGTINLPFPPVEKQRTIVEGIVQGTSKVESTIARLAKEIALVRDLRSRVISDVVTGKLDVRDAAARLPDQPSELQPDGALQNEYVETDPPEAELEALEA